MILLAATSGATVLSFEPEWDLWSAAANAHVGAEVIWPMLSRVVEQRLIATKAEVLERTRAAYQLKLTNTLSDFHDQINDLDPVSGHGTLSQAAYGLWWRGMSYEVVPDISDFFYVPLLPHDATSDVLGRFRSVFHHGDATTVEGWRRLLQEAHLQDEVRAPGSAYVAEVGGRRVVMHTRENLFERQHGTLVDVALPLAAPNVSVQTHNCRPGGNGTVVAVVSWTTVGGADNYTVHAVASPPVVPTDASGWQPPYDAFAFAPVMSVPATRPPRVRLDLPCAPAPYSAATLPPALPSVMVGVAVTASGRGLPKGNLTVSVNYLGYHSVPAGQTAVQHVKLVSNGNTGGKSSGLTEDTVDILAWPGDPRPTTLQTAWPTFVGVSPEHRQLAVTISARWDALVAAYTAADWRNVTAFYSRDYCDPNGFTREYAGRAFKWWLSRCSTPFAYYQDKSWVFHAPSPRDVLVGRSSVPRSSSGGNSGNVSAVSLCMYVQLRGVSVWDEPWDDHGLLRIPRALDKQACVGWRIETDGEWRIATTYPALPNLEEMLWNARGYAFPHTLTPGADEAFDRCLIPQPWCDS